jgi:hypothetical protein
MQRSLFGLLLISCAHPSGPTTPPNLQPYVEEIKREDVGVIPTSLEGSVVAPDAHDPTVAAASGSMSGLDVQPLSYAGLTADGMCFLYRDMLSADDADPAATILKPFTDDFLSTSTGGMWIEAVDALPALSTQAFWPPPAASVRVSSVDILSDEKVTLSEKKRVGGGDYVDVKHDYRIVSIKLCSPKPATTPASRFLVACHHHAPAASDITTEENGTGTHYDEAAVSHQHDALFVWALTDDGKFQIPEHTY